MRGDLGGALLVDLPAGCELQLHSHAMLVKGTLSVLTSAPNIAAGGSQGHAPLVKRQLRAPFLLPWLADARVLPSADAGGRVGAPLPLLAAEDCMLMVCQAGNVDGSGKPPAEDEAATADGGLSTRLSAGSSTPFAGSPFSGVAQGGQGQPSSAPDVPPAGARKARLARQSSDRLSRLDTRADAGGDGRDYLASGDH